MSRRLAATWLMLALLFASRAWALGLGDIRLESALGEPLRAEIEVTSATPEELDALFVQLATAETFARYGLDRPGFLTGIRFDVDSRDGRNFIAITTASPVVEPFVTILIEASWPQGRILREYTMLIDPPTFTPAEAVEAPPQVTAPSRTQEADRAVIERQPPQAVAPPATAPPAPQPRPVEQPAAPQTAGSSGGQVYRVAPSETLWGIARDIKPDEGVTINQTMVAIFEANPQAFNGNINRLRAGAYLTIPSADDIYRISRRDATEEVQRQMDAWSGGKAAASTRPSLSLVPPDEPAAETDTADYEEYRPSASLEAPDTELQDRVRDLERQIADQDALIEVRDNEIASLRDQLERLQSEQAAAGDEQDVAAGTAGVDLEDQAEPQPVPVTTPPAQKPGLFGTIVDFLTGFWGIVIGGLVILALVMVWLARRAVLTTPEEEVIAETEDGVYARTGDTTKIVARGSDDDSFVVVEGARGDAWSPDAADTLDVPGVETAGEKGFAPEETFSTDTAVNLDADDPIAEADFHMAYGLYDQAAELISNALAKDGGRKDLIAKLCEIYFVWGNKDEFVKAAERLHAALGDHPGSDWDKVAIMGQQIAGDTPLFAVGASLASSSVDLTFDEEEAGSALDIDFDNAATRGDTEIMDLGDDDERVDFVFDDADEETPGDDDTIETPAAVDDVEPVEQTEHMKVLGGAGSAEESVSEAQKSDQTAEIDLDDLGLDLEGLAESGITEGLDEDDLDLDLGDVDDQMAKTDFQIGKLDDSADGDAGGEDTKADFLDMDLSGEDLAANETGEDDVADDDLEITGVNEALEADDADDDEIFDIGEDFIDEADAETEVLKEEDRDGGAADDLGVDIDSSLLDATGQTEVLDDSMLEEIGEDESTVLADSRMAPDMDATRELPAAGHQKSADEDESEIALDDLDLELDDLTAALKVGDVAEDLDDLTTEHASLGSDKPAAGADETLDLDVGSIFDDDELTAALPAQAGTMTEVGTKLDLARAYIDMGDPAGARGILEEVIEEGDESHKQQAQQLLDSLPD